jgi:hypothetical protein
MDLWDEWTSHIPPIDPDYTESEEKDYIEAEKEKKNGNEAFTKGLYRRAIRHFTNAIELVRRFLGVSWPALTLLICRTLISQFIL